MSSPTYVLDDEVQQRQYVVRPVLRPATGDSVERATWELTDLVVLEAVEFGGAGQVLDHWQGDDAARFASRAWQLIERQPLLQQLMEQTGPGETASVPVNSAASTLERLRSFRQQSASLQAVPKPRRQSG